MIKRLHIYFCSLRHKSHRLISFGFFLLALMIWALFSSVDSLQAATIKKMTRGPFEVVRGDVVLISVEADDPNSEVAWWSEGELVCASATCEVDTSSFTAGEYLFRVVVSDAAGLSVASVSINASIAPPLYTPHTIKPTLSKPIADVVEIRSGDWIIVSRRGLISFSKKNPIKKNFSISFIGKPTQGLNYKVNSGAQAIVRKVGVPEHWLLDEGATFRFRNQGFDLVAGSGLWRRIDGADLHSSDAKIYGADVKSSGPGLLWAHNPVNTSNVSHRNIKNMEGADLHISCASRGSKELRTSEVLGIKPGGECYSLETKHLNDPSALISAFSPWWFGDEDELDMDRWRADYDLNAKTDEDFKRLLDSASNENKNKQCLAMLDGLSKQSLVGEKNTKFTLAAANCQFSMGLYARALKSFKDMEAKGVDPIMSAYMLARTYQALRQDESAIYWFKIADARGYSNRADLARQALKSAPEDLWGGQRLLWLDSLQFNETDDHQVQEAMSRANSWRESRPYGAVVSSSFYMDSQALPVNSKTIDVLPGPARSSRSTVVGLGAKWWTNKEMASSIRAIFEGRHALTQPTEMSLDFAGVALHDVTLGLRVGRDGRDIKSTNAGSNKIQKSNFYFEPRVNFGTAFTNGQRQRDRMGWTVSGTYADDHILTFGITSDKYLDPIPNSTDVIDIDSNRYTGPGDHSHMDLIVFTTLGAQSGHYAWSWMLDYASIDYRTGYLDVLDQIRMRLALKNRWQLNSRVALDLTPTYTSIKYKLDVSENIAEIRAASEFKIFPLWTIAFEAAMERRRVSDDPTTSWLRQRYGASVSREF